MALWKGSAASLGHYRRAVIRFIFNAGIAAAIKPFGPEFEVADDEAETLAAANETVTA